jgi:hypothetical protein
MEILGTALFALVFILLSPQSRAILTGAGTNAGTWIAKFAPYSYLVLVAGFLVPLIAVLIVFKWPSAPPIENPMARYKADDGRRSGRLGVLTQVKRLGEKLLTIWLLSPRKAPIYFGEYEYAKSPDS